MRDFYDWHEILRKNLDGSKLYRVQSILVNIFKIPPKEITQADRNTVKEIFENLGWEKHVVQGTWRKSKTSPQEIPFGNEVDGFENSLREGFAMAALTGLCAKFAGDKSNGYIAEYAWLMADAMMETRTNKRLTN